MNRSKQALNGKLNKKNQKEVHKTLQTLPTQDLYRDSLTAKELSKKFPKKMAKGGKLAAPKKIGIQKKSPLKKHSKRTGPSRELITTESTPAHSHREGAVWVKTLTKQGAMQRKHLNKTLSKKR